jgi:hypothetical protein
METREVRESSYIEDTKPKPETIVLDFSTINLDPSNQFYKGEQKSLKISWSLIKKSFNQTFQVTTTILEKWKLHFSGHPKLDLNPTEQECQTMIQKEATCIITRLIYYYVTAN